MFTKKLAAFSALFLSSVCIDSSVNASFISSVSPVAWSRPATLTQAASDLTTYAYWNGFASPAGPNVAATSINPNGTTNAYDAAAATDGAFNAGADLYSFSGVLNPTVTIPGYGISNRLESVIVQAQSFGSDINVNDLLVTYTDSTGSHSAQAGTFSSYSYNQLYISSSDVGFGLADNVDHEWSFLVPDNTSLTLSFGWDVVSSALQDISVDTRSVAVPEPASIGLLLLSGLTLTGRVRRHAQASN